MAKIEGPPLNNVHPNTALLMEDLYKGTGARTLGGVPSSQLKGRMGFSAQGLTPQEYPHQQNLWGTKSPNLNQVGITHAFGIASLRNKWIDKLTIDHSK